METRPVLGILGVLGSLLLAACGSSSAPTPMPAQIGSSTRHDGMRLTLTLPVESAKAGEPIAFTTTVEYLGPEPSIQFDAAGGELVGHGIRAFDGITYGPWSFNLDCTQYELKRGEVQEMPLFLATSVSHDDPNGAIITSAWQDGQLRLPAGLWAIDAAMRYYPEPDCDGPERWIGATVFVTVR